MPTQDSRLSGRRIMVVEDEYILAMELERVLLDAGCEVIGPFPSNERALAALARTQPEAVLLDLNLDDRTTEPVARALSARGIPFVVVTGYNRSFMTDPVFRDVPMVPKPLEIRVLLATLAGVLDP